MEERQAILHLENNENPLTDNRGNSVESVKECEESYANQPEKDISQPNARELNLIEKIKSPNEEVSFKGLQRKLGWHQETLSRTLKRLEDDGIMKKTATNAYRLSSGARSNSISQHGKDIEDITQVTKLWLSQNHTPEFIVSALKNSWFGAWRWYSFQDEDSEKVLKWIHDDGSIWTSLRIQGNTMTVESGPVKSIGRDRCIQSGYELVKHIMLRLNPGFSKPKNIFQSN